MSDAVGAGRNAERTLRVLRNQGAVQEASRFAALAVGHCDAACQQATSLVVSELAENMVKYSARSEDHRAGTIAIGVQNDVVCIRTTNHVESEADGRHVVQALSRIASAPDVKELYRRRLQELFGDPALPRAQLGLIRVAFEGGFRLSCSFEANVLEIVAERRASR